MQRLTRVAALSLLFALGCTTSPQPIGGSATLKVPAKTLAVAFDDIPVQAAATVPLSLTSSDGTGLKLVALRGRAVIDDPLAFTELHLTFENPESRVLEGTFSIVLPQGAAISRFAMRNESGFQEGEVVEKQQARQAYEDFLHRRQDPALLEQAGGNEFSARVFPIQPLSKKELIVSYSQELSRRAPYVLPLKGLPEIGSVDVQAFIAGRAAPVVSLSKQMLKPEGDLRVEPGTVGERAGVRNGNLVLARVTPVVGSQPEQLGSALFLVDTSASRALGTAEQARVLQRVCAGIARGAGDKARVLIAAFDQTIEPLYEGPPGQVDEQVTTLMRQRLALGASNLGAALAWAGEQARPRGISRVVLLTDGVPTAGETSGEKLRERAAALRGAGVERLDAIALGGIRDDDLLRSLVNAGLPRGGVVVDPGGMTEEEVWRRLNEATRSGVSVSVENAVFSFPQKVDGVQAGDQVLVYANVPDDKPARVSVGGGPMTSLDLVKVERPLLERAWVGAKIKSLMERERVEGASAALSREIVGLSTQHRVLSPKTALLVLETDRDYQRFGIDRRALADILVTDGARVSLMHRTLPDPPKPAQVVVDKTPPPARPPRLTPPSPPRTAGAAPAAKGAAKPEADAAIPHGPTGGGAAAPSRPMSRPAPDRADDEQKEILQQRASGPSAPAATAAPRAPAPDPAPAAPPPGAQASRSNREEGYGYEFSDDPRAPNPAVAPPRDARPASRPRASEVESSAPQGQPSSLDGELRGVAPREAPEEPLDMPRADPYTGPFKSVMDLVRRGQPIDAVKAAFEWRKTAPGDVMALVALGEAFEAAGEPAQAARCYGSVVDLFSARADLRRFAGERLEHLGLREALDLAIDTYEKAAAERPDHPASHRLYAFALLKRGRHQEAFEALARGLRRSYPPGRFAGVRRILSEDLGLIGAAWASADPKRAEEIRARVQSEGGSIENEPSLRFVLNWETDANDVDFHIYDSQGGHAFYSQPSLPSGGDLYADVTTGYGPECFTIRGRADARSGPYRLQAHYYSRGPMGYGMGKLQIIEHDGRGGLTFEERPFVVMIDRAFVDLGSVKR